MVRKKGFIVFPVSHGWIVYNTEKSFKEGHTHLRNKQSAMAIVDFVSKEKIPRRCDFYYLTSLTRLSNNADYTKKVLQLIAVRKKKGKKLKYTR